METAFSISAQTYVKTAGDLYGFGADNARIQVANASLYRFLAENRVAPTSWGFGEPGPRDAGGYVSSPKWWLDKQTNMRTAAGAGFATMRIPISSNRTSPNNYIGGRNPARPETWCTYLRNVRAFWIENGWLN